MKTIYRSPEAKKLVLNMYEEKLNSLDFEVDKIDVKTSFGNTRVLKTGNPDGEKIVLFHGVHAGSPLTLEAVSGLRNKYQLIAIDTIGQATKSDETYLDIKGNSFAQWANEVLVSLQIQNANFIGISYGAFILQKLIIHYPERISKAVFVVPAGLGNGDFWPSTKKLTIPLMRFMITKKRSDLKKFISSFVHEEDRFMEDFQWTILTGVRLDMRRPPILSKKDVLGFDKPVYLMVAENDIFFPGEKAIHQAEKTFANVKDVLVLKNSKHMPFKSDYPLIQDKIAEWVG